MKTLIKCNLGILLTLCFSIAIFSCNHDEIANPDENSNGIQVSLYTIPTSFNETTPNESHISNMKALVYILIDGNYVFDYSADIKNIYEGNTGYTNFSLILFGETKPVKVTIIANADDAVSEANPSFRETEIDINQRINKSFTSKGVHENLPMWAEFFFPQGISSSLRNTMFGAKALRALARVDIDASRIASVFEMTSIQIFRANNSIQLVPNAYTTDPLKVDTPSIPSSGAQNINTEPIFISQNTFISQLYLPESVAPELNDQVAGATCVVIGGRFNGSADTTYYRLDFDPPISGYPLGQILRNHQYTFNITNVNGPGWPTPDDAANNVSSHVLTSVLDWTDNFINVNIGGRNFFFINTRRLNLSGDINSTTSVNIETDVANCTLHWSDASGNPTDEFRGTNIVNDYFAASISSSQITVESKSDNNPGNGIREQFFTVVAGRLRVPIQIIQDEAQAVPRIEWSQFNVAEHKTFASSSNDFGRLYVWDMGFISYPNTGDVSNQGWPSSNSSSQVWNANWDPCPNGWRIPTGDEFTELLINNPSWRVYRGTESGNPNFGVWIGPTQNQVDNATFSNPGNTLFFPLSGQRTSPTISSNVNVEGTYWAFSRNHLGRVPILRFRANVVPAPIVMDVGLSLQAFSVRCVRDK